MLVFQYFWISHDPPAEVNGSKAFLKLLQIFKHSLEKLTEMWI